MNFLNRFFKKENENSFQNLVKQIKKGERDILSLLHSSQSEFQNAPFDTLMENTDDVLAGVNRVQMNFHKKLLTPFENTLIKHHDNGDIKFVFYTTTTNTATIHSIAETLFSELGHGMYDNRKFRSFKEKDKIEALSKGIYTSESDEIVQMWIVEDVHFILQYRVDPLQQFSLMIVLKAPKIPDIQPRNKGTILSLLHFDIQNVLSQNPDHTISETTDGKLAFKEYFYTLPVKELKCFDQLKIRIFGPDRQFSQDVQTHVTLFSRKSIDSANKIHASETLIRMYGPDDTSPGELQIHERETLEEGGFWVGRMWHLNSEHGLFKHTPEEKMVYYITVNDMEDDEGFHVFIGMYNGLVRMFGK